MSFSGLTLSVMEESFAVCRLERDAAVPARVFELDFFSITRTRDEISIVTPEGALQVEELPEGAEIEPGWVCLAVAGPLDFSLVGVLAGLSGTLAGAGVSVFSISTYDTDYLLIKDRDLRRAREALSAAGYRLTGDG